MQTKIEALGYSTYNYKITTKYKYRIFFLELLKLEYLFILLNIAVVVKEALIIRNSLYSFCKIVAVSLFTPTHINDFLHSMLYDIVITIT